MSKTPCKNQLKCAPASFLDSTAGSSVGPGVGGGGVSLAMARFSRFADPESCVGLFWETEVPLGVPARLSHARKTAIAAIIEGIKYCSPSLKRNI